MKLLGPWIFITVFVSEQSIKVILTQPSTTSQLYNVNPIFTVEWGKNLYVRYHTNIISYVTLDIVFTFSPDNFSALFPFEKFKETVML